MKKNLIAALLLVMASVSSASAQFEKGKYYLGATTNAAGLSYGDQEKLRLNAGVHGGYMFEDAWMGIAEAGFDYHNSDLATFYVGAKCRYLIEQNGVFLQMGAKFLHAGPSFNDVQLTPEVGYCLFLNQHLTIEPSAYVDLSVSDFTKKSKYGLKVGLGWLF